MIYSTALLAPAATLILWSILVLLYMVIVRFKAFKAMGLDMNTAAPGTRYADVEPQMPTKVNWVSHNHTHLMEQPTLFYAVVAVLAIAGDNSALSLGMAWGYTLLRIAHSLWQVFVNRIPGRVLLFTVSTLLLLGLAINAVRITLF